MKKVKIMVMVILLMSLPILSRSQNLPQTIGSSAITESLPTHPDENNLNGITIFPNPVHLKLSVNITQSVPPDMSFVFYSIYGKKIEEGLITGSNHEIDIIIPLNTNQIFTESQLADIWNKAHEE